MTANPQPPIVVSAPVPKPPVLSLVGSALRPPSGADPAVSAPTEEQLAELAPELRKEIEERRGPIWVRGFTYAPEQQGGIEVRSGFDFTSIDSPALPTPAAPTGTPDTAAGTIGAGTYNYKIAAINANGHTAASAQSANVVLGATGEITVSWNPIDGDAVQYAIFGRVAGSLGLLAVVGPFDLDQPTQWLDTGSVSPGAAPYATNTTGGAGTYTNPAIVTYFPYLLIGLDECSSVGWSERDFIGRAKRWLENGKYAAIEKEFQTGLLAQAKGFPNNYLTNTASVVDLTPGTIPSIARGQAILQDALAQTGSGGQGMIHCEPQTTPSLLNARRVGAMMFDEFDNIVVPGSGYQNLGPGNVAPSAGYAWMYATDLVTVWEEDEPTVIPETMAEAMDWGQGGQPNTLTFRAQKYAGASFDAQRHFACKVALPA